MQDNHFEKDIAEKLGNFPVQPSEKVWLDIEATLTKPNRKRFAWWWLPLLLLLSGGVGGYFLFTNNQKENTPVLESDAYLQSKKVDQAKENEKLGANAESKLGTTIQPQATPPANIESIDFANNKAGENIVPGKQPTTFSYGNNRKRNGWKKKYSGTASASVTNAGVGVDEEYVSTAVKDNSVIVNEVKADAAKSSDGEMSAGLENRDVSLVKIEASVDRKVDTFSTENKSTDTPIQPMVTKKSNKQQRPLKIALSLFGGSAELSNNGSQEKLLLMDQLYLGGIPQNQNYTVIREVIYPQKRFRLGAGVLLKYPLYKKFSLLSGMQYGYIKNSMNINISRDTIIGVSFSTVYNATLKGDFSMHILNVPMLISFDMLHFKKGMLNIAAGADNNFIIAQRPKNMPAYFSRQRIYQPLLHLSANYVFLMKDRQLEIGSVFNTNLFSAIKQAYPNYKWLYAGAAMKLYFK